MNNSPFKTAFVAIAVIIVLFGALKLFGIVT